MPTGYTSGLYDGTETDFRTFALRCARAFGATVMQRDESIDSPPRHREESSYNRNALADAQAALAKLDEMTIDEVRAAIAAENAEAEAANADYRAKHEARLARYQSALRDVEAWNPPTPDHEELQKFMREQIAQSIEFDCGNSGLYQRRVFTGSPEQWVAERRAKAFKDIAYHASEHEKEVQRCREANEWIDALYASLPLEVR